MSTTLSVSCYQDLKLWVRKHRKALIVTAVAGAGVYFTYQYYKWSADKKDKEIKHAASELQREAEVQAEAQVRGSLEHHFNQIQRIADTTTLPSVLEQMRDRLFELVDLASLTERLMAGKQEAAALSSREKLEIWEALKVLSFTRAVTAVCSVCLMDLFLRTQLNILARHLYIETAQGEGTSQAAGQPVGPQCQRTFILFAKYLPHAGLEGILARVRAAVDRSIGSLPLKTPCLFEDLAQLVDDICEDWQHSRVLWSDFVLPPENSLPESLKGSEAAPVGGGKQGELDEVDVGQLDLLLNETREILNSDEFHGVMSAAIGSALGLIREELKKPYIDAGDLKKGIPLAKLLPFVAGLSPLLLEHPEDNRFIIEIAGLAEVQSFCAMVYSNPAETASSTAG